jgi:hypothetical protein
MHGRQSDRSYGAHNVHCKENIELLPCLVCLCVSLPLTTSIRKDTWVEDQKKGNFSILCIMVVMPTGVGAS